MYVQHDLNIGFKGSHDLALFLQVVLYILDCVLAAVELCLLAVFFIYRTECQTHHTST